MAPMLEGYRVLDLGQYLAGAGVTRMLAELGPEIIKVELMPSGDPSRLLPWIVEGRSTIFIQNNRGKRSVCVDWDTEEGRQIILELAGRCDAVVENFGPGVLARRGLDYEALRRVRPDLVMVSISAYGQTSPWSDRPGFDGVIQATSGLMHMAGDPDGPPSSLAFAIADNTTAVHGFAALGFALLHRERTGEGQHVDLAMADVMFHLQDQLGQHVASGGAFTPKRVGRHHPMYCPVGTYELPEGYGFLLCLDRQWPNLARAMGRPDLIDDPRFATNTVRARNQAELIPIVQAWLLLLPRQRVADGYVPRVPGTTRSGDGTGAGDRPPPLRGPRHGAARERSGGRRGRDPRLPLEVLRPARAGGAGGPPPRRAQPSGPARPVGLQRRAHRRPPRPRACCGRQPAEEDCVAKSRGSTSVRSALEPYRAKRDFRQSPEPAGSPEPAEERAGAAGAPRFVVQRHRARRLHYDFRLEIGGVLVSWAVPKGPTLDPAARHLAVHVEDHPIEYFDFEGVIPHGEYGGGDVIVWDRGTWEPVGTDDPAAGVAAGELHVDLHGEKLSGRFVLIRRGGDERGGRSRGQGGRDWLLLHKRDADAVAGWDPEDHPRSVKSGRTNDEVAADPDALWRSDLPAAEAEVAVDSQPTRSTRRRPGQSDESPGRPRRSLTRSMRSAPPDAGASGGRTLSLTNLDKVLFPARRRAKGRPAAPKTTKRDLIRHYATMAPAMLPYLAGRPVNLHRFPDGVDAAGFWHKARPWHAPDWVTGWRYPDARPGETRTTSWPIRPPPSPGSPTTGPSS